MKKSEINEILHLHKLWLEGLPEGKQANLWIADLREAALQNIVLSHADLKGACLREADLSGSNLFGADLRDADLHHTNLWGVDLRRVEINPDNPSVLYKSENITILDTETEVLYAFTSFTTSTVTKKEIKRLKELLSVICLNESRVHCYI